jgi:hypothetical protein
LIKNGNFTNTSIISKFDVNYFEKNKPNYIVRVIPLDSKNVEAAELTVNFDKNDGSTKIMTASYGGETFHQQYIYYFNDINNFLLIEKFQQWDRPYSEDRRLEKVDEINKYYFENISMVVWIDSDGKIVDSQSKKFKQKEQEILGQLDKLLVVLNTGERK